MHMGELQSVCSASCSPRCALDKGTGKASKGTGDVLKHTRAMVTCMVSGGICMSMVHIANGTLIIVWEKWMHL